ncbi:TetR/AcrR family transcriptional regulator [Pedobacter sp.]
MKEKGKTPPQRNKEESRKKFLWAVGQIITTKGFAGLKLNHIAATAQLDKKLIYRYFGGLNQLLDEYVKQQDFWSNVKASEAPELEDVGGKKFVTKMLTEQFDYVFQNKEFQKILLWRLSEERPSLQKLAEEQEKNGELLFENLIAPHFGEQTSLYRGISAIIVSGLYYLNLSAEVNGSIFCGIDLKTEAGRIQIKKAITFILDQTYNHL